MKWIKQKLRNWMLSDREYITSDSDYEAEQKLGYYSTVRGDILNSCDCITFKVYNAKGGTVVEVTKNSSRKEHENNLYIINSTEDFGEEISKILFLEKL